MTPEDNQWVKQNIALVMRQCLNATAESQVLKEVLADLVSQCSDRPATDVFSEIQERVKLKQEKYLLDLEKSDPGFAALMDASQPPTT